MSGMPTLSGLGCARAGLLAATRLTAVRTAIARAAGITCRILLALALPLMLDTNLFAWRQPRHVSCPGQPTQARRNRWEFAWEFQAWIAKAGECGDSGANPPHRPKDGSSM